MERPDDDDAQVREVKLRDGSRIWVRPIIPADRSQLEQGMQWLSDRSRYFRFHSNVAQLSSGQLDYLTDVDHHDHEALVAFDPDMDDRPGVGVARYIRLEDEPHIAEAAITVIDSHQGRGIGTALIGLLQPLAYERGIRTFRNYVLAENRGMLSIFRDLDGSFESEGSGLYRVDVPIPEPDAEHPATPAGRWVAEVAKAQPPDESSWAYPLLWMIRRVGTEVPATRERLLKLFTGDDDPDPGEEEA